MIKISNDAISCAICGGNMVKWHTAKFKNYGPLSQLTYVRCQNCQFIFAHEYASFTPDDLKIINATYHDAMMASNMKSEWGNTDSFRPTRMEIQKDILRTVIANYDTAVDYACGNGDLTNSFDKFTRYDKYYNPCVLADKYDLVVCTSYIEHIYDIDELHRVFSLVGDKGAMLLHTWIGCKEDQYPSNEYMLAVHCSFFSNKSLQIACKKYGFVECHFNDITMTWLLSKVKIGPVHNMRLVEPFSR